MCANRTEDWHSLTVRGVSLTTHAIVTSASFFFMYTVSNENINKLERDYETIHTQSWNYYGQKLIY